MDDNELKKLSFKVDALSGDVSEIRRAILGDEFNTKGGIMQRLESLETRMDNSESFITKWKWILIGATGLGGYGGLTFVQQLLEIIGNAAHKK